MSRHRQSGVTIIELLVSVAIFAIITGVVLIGFVGSGKHNQLRLAADALANDLRRLQSSAIGGEEINGAVPAGFGISFDFTGATTNRQYSLFGDTMTYVSGVNCSPGANQRNDTFLSGATCLSEPKFANSPVQFPGTIILEKMYIGGTLIDSNNQRRADITFKTPEAIVHAHYGSSFSSHDPATAFYLPTPATNQTVIMCLKHTQLNLYRKVTLLGATGQITIGNATPTCP